MHKPSHYLVVRSPYAEALVLGIKSFEWRSWGDTLAGKTVGIAVARALSKLCDFEEQADFWNATKKEKSDLIDLFGQCSGKIIGQVTFGKSFFSEWPKHGFGVESTKAILWDKKDWLESPGGLGLRPIR